MKILVNGCNLIVGGGLAVGRGIAEALLNSNSENEIHLFFPKRASYNFSSRGNVHIHYMPRIFTDYSIGRWFGVYYLAYQARRFQVDAVFSLGNYALPVSCRQLLLLQWPYAVYPAREAWPRMKRLEYFKRKLRLFFFRRNLKYTGAVTVQTELMKKRMKASMPDFRKKIYVVESSFKKREGIRGKSILRRYRQQGNEVFLLCLSEYYHHKNLEILLSLAELIRDKDLPYKIVLTINPRSRGAARLLEKTTKKGLGSVLLNLGRIHPDETGDLYKDCHALLLPTLLESYGIPYLEAAYAGIPVFTSDLDFARFMNGSTAWYFDPLSPESILMTIQEAFSNPEIMKEKIRRASEKANGVRSWEEITRQYLEIIAQLPG